jgi:16S rRNA (uracil1498-N3)-methyltransferase
MDLILQKATELGVTAIVPLISERTVVQAAGEGSNRLARWRSIVLEACKQCGNNWLPAVAAPVNAREFLAGLAPVVEDRELRLIGSLQPDARPLKAILAERPRTGDAAPAALVVIGPEGDFTPAELIDARAAGCRPLSLGPLVLRSDTAAFYALSILHHELQG